MGRDRSRRLEMVYDKAIGDDVCSSVGSEKVKKTPKRRSTSSAEDSSPFHDAGIFILRRHIALGNLESRLNWSYLSSKKVSHLSLRAETPRLPG